MPEIINVGICGAGWVVVNHHIPDLRQRTDRYRIAGMYDVLGAEAKAFSDTDVQAYATYDDLLADAAVDLVLIATKPLTTHHPAAKQALQAGKHVLMEKPMASTSAECDDLIATAESSGVTFTIHHNRRLDIDFMAVQDLIARGKVGDALLIENRTPSGGYGDGDFVDWGVHLVDQALLLNRSELLEVSTVCCNPQGGVSGCGWAEATFRFARPPVVRLAITPWPNQFLSNGMPAHARFMVYGSKGAFAQRVIEDPRDLVNATQNFDGFKPDYEVPAYLRIDKKHYYDYLYESLTQGAPLLVKPGEARNAIRALELMTESAVAGKTIAATNMLSV